MQTSEQQFDGVRIETETDYVSAGPGVPGYENVTVTEAVLTSSEEFVAAYGTVELRNFEADPIAWVQDQLDNG